MCGIGGFSLSKGSKIRPRMLSNALLTALEDRGYMASGIAWHSDIGSGYYKGAIPGSGLPLKSVPKDINVGIVHTRLATHGSTEDNRNNHPVQSPSKNISLVHNGVIYNHNYVRSILSKRIKFEVDTAVIPAILEEQNHDLASLRELDGDAAIAWLRDDDKNVLRLARLEHSPLVICQVEDGSFIFASTEALLWKVLIKMDLMPDMIRSIDEFTYLEVRDGVITEMSSLERPKHTGSKYDYSYYRHQTAGAKGSKSSSWGDADWDEWYDYNGYDYQTGLPNYDDSYDYMVDKATKEHAWKDTQGNALVDFYGSPITARPAYYIMWANAFVDTPSDANTNYAFYPSFKYEDYEDDIHTIEQYQDYVMIDYGVVSPDGEMLSDKAKHEVVTYEDATLF